MADSRGKSVISRIRLRRRCPIGIFLLLLLVVVVVVVVVVTSVKDPETYYIL